MSVQVDAEDNVWIGTLGGSLHRMKGGKIETLDTGGIFPDETVYSSIFRGKNNNIWIGTYGRGIALYRDEKFEVPESLKFLAKKPISMIFQDSRGDYWISIPKAGLLRYSNGQIETFSVKNGLPSNHVKAAAEDKNGNIWFGTSNAGIFVYRDGKIIPEFLKEPLLMESVLAIYADSKGLVWIATTGGGVNIYDGTKLFSLTQKNGLPNNSVLDILEDGESNLWMSSNRGVFRIRRENLKKFINGDDDWLQTEVFDTRDGLLSSEGVGGTQPTGAVSMSGSLYFPTTKGLVEINPEKIRVNSMEPPVKIEDVFIDGKVLHRCDGDCNSFQGSVKRVEFHYTALSFINSSDISFKYMLEGFDNDWITSPGSRVANYTNLTPGKYRFRVIAANSDGTWNRTGAEVDFEITPFFHQTLYFRLGMFLIVFFLIYLLMIMRTRTTEIQNRKLAIMVLEKTKELRDANLELKEMALIDPLTGLRNRRYFNEVVMDDATAYVDRKRSVISGKESRESLSGKVWGVFLVDMDYFKQVNDIYGHDAGDMVLKQLAEIFRESVRREDVVIRWGGEEFLIILKESNPSFVDQFADRLKVKVEQHDFKISSGETIEKTISTGFLEFPFYSEEPSMITLEQAVSIADHGLYYSKNHGRNLSVKLVNGENMPENGSADHKMIAANFEYAKGEGFIEVRIK